MDESGSKPPEGVLCERHEECGYLQTKDITEKIRERLSLGPNERIKRINGIEIDVNTEMCLTELFAAKSGQSVVVIEKQDAIDPENDLETDDGFSEYAVRFTYECRRDSFWSITFHHFFHPPLVIKDILYRDTCNCQIRSYEETGKFLTVKDGRLTLAPILDRADKSHVFTERQYKGKEYRADGTIKIVQLRTYMSNLDNKYVSATFFHHVKLEVIQLITSSPDDNDMDGGCDVIIGCYINAMMTGIDSLADKGVNSFQSQG